MALRVGDIITISYVERCDDTVISTNIEQVADPAEQFSLIVNYVFPKELDTFFEDGTGIIDTDSHESIKKIWVDMKKYILFELFSRLSFLKTLEYRETYNNPFLSCSKNQRKAFNALYGKNHFADIDDFLDFMSQTDFNVWSNLEQSTLNRKMEKSYY